MNDAHLARRLEKALADDERTNELGVHVLATSERLVAVGEVATEDRRQTVLEVLHEHEPQLRITDQITVSSAALDPPHRRETIDCDDGRHERPEHG